MTEPLGVLDAGCVDASLTAVFLDFDGTLVEIADHPDLVVLSPQTRDAVSRIRSALGGALAIITGRDIGNVDQFLAPLHLPVAGVHGLKRRGVDGCVYEPRINDSPVVTLNARIRPFAEGFEGLLLERKPGSIALHYRRRPDLEEQCIEAMDAAAHGIHGIHLLRGKMVIEAKVDASDKGGAIEGFLSEPPFAGRIPFFAGDDATDEDAFAIVNRRGGISVKVGPGPTQARYRAASTPEFLAWLQSVADTLERARTIEQP